MLLNLIHFEEKILISEKDRLQRINERGEHKFKTLKKINLRLENMIKDKAEIEKIEVGRFAELMKSRSADITATSSIYSEILLTPF